MNLPYSNVNTNVQYFTGGEKDRKRNGLVTH